MPYFTAFAYNTANGKTRRFGRHATLEEAQRVLEGAHAKPEAWNTPDHRGQQPGTWTAIVDCGEEGGGEWELVAKQHGGKNT